MEYEALKKNKIFLLFILGLGIPSILLGFLAYRGIKNDQALLEKERINDHRRISQSIIESLDEKFVELEFHLNQFINNNSAYPPDSLLSLKNELPLIQDIFILEKNGNIQFPAAAMNYVHHAEPAVRCYLSLLPICK